MKRTAAPELNPASLPVGAQEAEELARSRARTEQDPKRTGGGDAANIQASA
ncbi:MAG TPA: hypothetical protein VF815_23835 [Myxococcaceae bacterium]|jgi:hypothetical protein